MSRADKLAFPAPSRQEPLMQFASDNWAGAEPRIVEAIAREAARSGSAYGASAADRAIEERFSEIFERDVAVFPVGTGSAANGLAMAAVAKPGGVVFCHRGSHMIEDECGGVEYLTGGARLFPLDGPDGKLEPTTLREAIARFDPDFVHAGQPMAVSITQQSEAGGIYCLAEIAAIAAVAKECSLPLHMDGSRCATALARLKVSPAAMTWKAGVDILSFGATKNGCMVAEALVFFDRRLAAEMPFLRKRAGHLFSKSRFLAAQFDAYFRDGLWLQFAGHAVAMADRLRAGLGAAQDAREAWPTEGNEVFAIIRRIDAARLREAGAAFYDWPEPHDLPLGLTAEECLVRLVTNFSTTAEEVDRFAEGLA
jgi:threonine aldolase